VVSATFPAIATTGWTHAAETLATPAGGPFQSTTFSWTTTPTNPTGFAVNALDSATNASSSGITFTSDTTAPAGGGAGYAAGVVTALSVPVTTTYGTDGQSGVNAASGIVKRDVATLAPLTQTCGAFSGTYTTVSLVGGADTTVATSRCYKYEYLVSDNVGNQATFVSSAVAKVDTSGPRVTAIASQELAGGAGDGKIENGDKLILTFNQSLASASVPTSFSGATLTRGPAVLFVGAPTARLTIPGITDGSLDTGGSYFACVLLCGAAAATFDGTVVRSNAGTATTVTITVSNLHGDAPQASSGDLGFKPATTITDGGGNAAAFTFTANNFPLF
jgi:hypothetical protein